MSSVQSALDISASPDDWHREAVVYQIFVDRFARGNQRATIPDQVAWGTRPTRSNFMGGDLAGITHKLDYIASLGANVICLTPIFASNSNHRYNTHDYYRIDPGVGDLRAFRRLLSEAHQRGIRVLLDGTFNHCGSGFFPFVDVVSMGPNSPYKDWFYIEGFPLFDNSNRRYAAWQDVAELPELNLAHPETQKYFLEVAVHWTRQGIDGWRLDAVRHVRHRPFWNALRDAIRAVRPDAYLLAEIWEDAQPWLETEAFDGATNYPLREILFDFVVHRSLTASQFARRVQRRLQKVSWQTTLGMLNLLGSHDTERLWSTTGRDTNSTKLLMLLQFVLPGIPAIYYGDELGMGGGQDPDNRRAMPWHSTGRRTDLQDHIRKLATLRKTHEALQSGNWQTLWNDDKQRVCAFLRQAPGDFAIIVINGGEQALSCSIPLPQSRWLSAGHRVDCVGDVSHELRDHELTVKDLPARSGAVFVPSD